MTYGMLASKCNTACSPGGAAGLCPPLIHVLVMSNATLSGSSQHVSCMRVYPRCDRLLDGFVGFEF